MEDKKELLLYVLESQDFYEFYNANIKNQIIYNSDNDKDNDSENLLEGHIEKIKSPECYIGVLGIQGSGKSSLLNSIIFKDEVLPVNVEETTCIPTLIRRLYPNEKEGVEIHYFEGKVEPAPLKREFLEKIVDNSYNPGNLMGVSHVVCKTDSPFLKEGFTFVDLPGVGSLTEQNEIATTKFLKETNVGIFLLRTVPPITESEAGFIRLAWPMLQESIFVQNLWAQETEEELKQGLKHNAKVLKKIADEKETQAPRNVIPINVSDACKASFSGDTELLGTSGVKELKKLLRKYAKVAHFTKYSDTAKYFIRLILRSQESLNNKLKIYKSDKKSILKKIEEAEENFTKNKDSLEIRLQRHCEKFKDNILELKTDWLSEELKITTDTIIGKLDALPIEDFKEEEFRETVRDYFHDYFSIVYSSCKEKFAQCSEEYIKSLGKTLSELATFEDIMSGKDSFIDNKKDPNAVGGWGIFLSGSLAPLLLTGPVGWSVFGGAVLAGSLARWISGNTAHKRILRGVRKSLSDSRQKIKEQICSELDFLSEKVTTNIKNDLQQELNFYEKELNKLKNDLAEEKEEKEEYINELEEQINVSYMFLENLQKLVD